MAVYRLQQIVDRRFGEDGQRLARLGRLGDRALRLHQAELRAIRLSSARVFGRGVLTLLHVEPVLN